VALLEKRRFLYNHSGDFPQVILIIPSHVPNTLVKIFFLQPIPFVYPEVFHLKFTEKLESTHG
jgi:hypothetical protein